ncbi:UPF0481 protein At3g47200-like [Triticum dicoccoides]|uniref:Uncharacterized protein n=1 Tax=Triticum turgidum subsp. durum TaxID=4567 RepID=A0A9R0XRM3_TRITD|nr:UPF0481 protein At3g47200-like [Triticum dicoccoides]VAI41775.1 unnamed protein product [Triticum turgidum subsp. durum]
MAAAGGSSSKRTWVVDVEKKLKEADKSAEVSRWERHCIYQVPPCMTNIKSKAYQPQVVSLGPFHHGDRDLRPMEEHKHRALRQLLLRANRPLDDFVAAVEEVTEELEGAYMDLDNEWRADGGGRDRFLAMMIFDGCFLLEVMRCTAADGKQVGDYAHNDPIFSPHGILYMVPYIRRDVLMLENQLPLLLLQKLVEVESGKPQSEDFINRMVLKFLAQSSGTLPAGIGLGLHPLDVFRRSMLTGKHHKIRSPQDIEDDNAIIRSAVELYEAGIQFKPSKTLSLHDIRFRRGTLSMPTVSVDDSTEYMFLNMMAFERLHAGAGNDVTGYVFFMDNIIDSAKDVALLSSKGIIQNAIGSDQAVAKLFNTISRDVVLEPNSALDAVQRQVNGYFRQPWNMWRANLIHTYFRSPWAFLSLAAAIFLLGMTIMQTVYTVLQFYGGDSNSPPPSAPSPM